MQSFPPALPLRVFICVVMLTACYGAEPTGPNQPEKPEGPGEGRLVLVPKADTLDAIGDTLRLTAGLVGGQASLQAEALKWRSVDREIATVDDRGTVISRSAGTALIVVACAACSARADTASVTVDQSLTSVVVTPNGNTLKVGDTQRFEATALDPNGMGIEDAEFEWSSSDTDVVTIEDGQATAVGLGSATIAATSEGKAGTARLTVSDRPVASVSVEPTDTTIDRGRTAQLRATAFDPNGQAIPDASFGWSSSLPSVATVDGEGLVSAESVGSAKITASAGGESGSSDVTVVQPPVESIEVAPSSATIVVGGSVQLDATAYDASGDPIEGVSFNWSSSDGSVASVDGSGFTTGVATGSATITASADGKSGSSAVTVTSAPVDSVSVSPSSATIKIDETIQLTATAYDAAGNVISGASFQWSSLNTSVAGVDGNGLVTGVSEGTAQVQAATGGKTGGATIAVESSSSPPSDTIAAFPGAEGFGALALSACDRSSLEVLEVTNLNDSGAGSLREAILASDASRFSVIVFRTGGTIRLNSTLDIGGKNCLYIAGQTAPGDGIQVHLPGGVVMNIGFMQDLAVRYLRLRSGKGNPGTSDVVSISSGHRMIFDHVSAQFGNDEVFTLKTVDFSNNGAPVSDVTLQRSIVAAGLRPHSTGSLISYNPGLEPSIRNVSFHHNLYAHNSHRNPRIAASQNIQIVNNVVYNWRNRVGGMNNGASIDYRANYFEAGPWSGPGSRILEHGPDALSSLYLEANVAIPKQSDPNADQRNLITYDKRTNNDTLPSTAFRSQPLGGGAFPISITPASQAFSSVLGDVGVNKQLDCAGNWVQILDPLDQQIVGHVQQGTGPGSDAENDHENDYGGIPTLNAGTPCTDQDADGMPDTFETNNNLDPLDPGDAAQDPNGDGYVSLEAYLAGIKP